MRQVGYATGHFGKWHLGGGSDIGDAPLPSAYGFDESYTQWEGLGTRVLPTDLKHRLGQQSATAGQGQVEWLSSAEITHRAVAQPHAFMDRRHGLLRLGPRWGTQQDYPRDP